MEDSLKDQLHFYEDARRQGFVTALTIKTSGGHVGGIYGTNLPKELFWAMGLTPVNLYSIDSSNIKAGAAKMAPENCALLLASYGYAITDKCPFTHFSDVIVANDGCYNKLAMLQKLASFKQTYVLPEENEIDQMVNEYERFIAYIKQTFNLELDPDKLKNVILKTNQINQKVAELTAIFMQNQVAIGCLDFYNILYGNEFIFDLDEKYAHLAAITTSLKHTVQKNNAPFKKLLLFGAPQAGLREKVLAPLQEKDPNLKILTLSDCEAENYKQIAINKEPLTALAEKYLVKDPLDDLKILSEKYAVNGLINLNLEGCKMMSDTYLYQKIGLPILTLNTDYYAHDTAFLSEQLNDFIDKL